jgi:hypothetical protein
MEEPSVTSFKHIFEKRYYEFLGTCKDVGKNYDLPWEDATEMSHDLGWFDMTGNWEETDRGNGDWEAITPETFFKEVNKDNKQLNRNHDFIFARSSSDGMILAFDEDEDIHYFYG